MRNAILVVLALVLVACPPLGPVTPRNDASDAQVLPVDATMPDAQDGDAGPGDAGDPWGFCPIRRPQAAVSAACARMRALGCPLGQPTPRLHETCECLLARLGALGEVNTDLACLASAKACSDVSGCNR